MAARLHVIDDAPAGAAMRLRLSGFVRTLRDNGFVVGLAESRDALSILSSEAALSPDRLRAALKALICSRRSDWESFDGLFDAFWLGRGLKVRAGGAAELSRQGRTLRAPGVSAGEHGQPDHVERGEGGDAGIPGSGRREGASRAETLAASDFRHLTEADDVAEAHRLAERLARAMRARLTRRERSRRRGRALDLRATIHRSIPRGGAPIDLVFRARKPKPLRLVVLLDASGSMSLYVATFLRFMHGVVDAFREAEAFLFHTRLIHVSPALRERDPQRAVEKLTIVATGLGGGTRIGESLRTFNRWHAKRVIHSRTCVMIVSDGYDVGPPEALSREMAALRRRCKRIAWLNPMIGWRGYSPEAAGMKAALPYVDLFAPAHNLKSLSALEPYLARL